MFGDFNLDIVTTTKLTEAVPLAVFLVYWDLVRVLSSTSLYSPYTASCTETGSACVQYDVDH